MNSSVRIANLFLTSFSHRTTARRFLSHYPIDDVLFNLNDEQIQVISRKYLFLIS